MGILQWKRYSKEHEYVNYDLESNIGTVGITNYAQDKLSHIHNVELIRNGTKIRQSDFNASIRSAKKAAQFWSPVSGEVIEVHDDLHDHPGIINESAEAEGWLYKIKLSDPDELYELLNEEEYKNLCINDKKLG